MLPNLTISPEEQERYAAVFHSVYNAPDVDFSTRLINLRNEQTKVIETHGRDGRMAVLEYEIRQYTKPHHLEGLSIIHFANAPIQSPWFDSRRFPLERFIADVWKNFRGPFVETLQANCIDAFVVQASGKWYLLYAYETSHYNSGVYCDFMAGREPELHPVFPAELTAAGWRLPGDLARLYSVHGAFGEVTAVFENGPHGCILPAGELELSLTFLDAVAKEDGWEIDYSFHNLLPFYEDGSGNSQNFYKILRNDDSYMTVGWDHETTELGNPEPLAEYLDRRFGDMMMHWG